MSPVQRPLGIQLSNDPVIRALGYTLWCVPVLVAVTLGWQMLARGPAPRTSQTPIAPVTAVEKPVKTQAVLRPRREAVAQATFEAPASQNQLLAMAFMPTVDVSGMSPASNAERTAERRELTTASVRPAASKAQIATARLENRPWRMQTLRQVGVAEGLKLISEGSMLTLAGVQPLDSDAKCKRLDGVMEPCSTRAASRLEVLTRGRVITCRVYEAVQGEPTAAHCRADKIDLAEDLVKNGLARRGQV